MRQMTDGETTLDVHEHILLRNFWEYYILEPADKDGIAFALVLGDFDEMGDVSLDEVKPHIISRTKNLDEILPATGYTWV